MGMTTKQILQGVHDWSYEKFYDKETLDAKLHNEYARQDGAYEEMLVGAAMDLQGEQVITDDAMYQPTGGHNKDVGSGEAEIVNIKGKTVKWNQIVPEGLYAAGEMFGSMTRSGSTYTCVSKATEQYENRRFTNIAPVLEHTYLISIDVLKNEFTSSLRISPNPSATNTMLQIPSGQTGRFQLIGKKVESAGENAWSMMIFNQQAAGFELVFGNFCVIDLTLIYGAGNEPSSAAQFEQDYFNWFGKPLTYEPYDEGSLRSSKMSAFKSVGFNQYNNGSAKVIGGLQYQITGTYTGITLNGETITPDSNGLFTPSTTGTLTIAGGDASTTCVHLVHSGERNGEYEAYWDETKSIPTTTLKGKLNGEGESVTIFPDGMRSAGNVSDELYVSNGKTYAVKRIDSVDLGSLTWSKSGNFAYSQSLQGNNFSQSIVSKYDIYHVADGQLPERSDIYFQATGNVFRIWNVENATAADIESSMNGVMLNYELAEPLVYEVEDFELPINYKVDDYGTEEVIGAENSVAPVISAKYSINAPDTIKNLPKNYISTASMDNFLNRLGIAMNGTWTKTWNASTNSYDFTFTPNA